MKAVIPVAGSGTRLRPLTHTKPKALLYVGSKPIIAHIVDTLISLGCKEFILIISSEGFNIPCYLKKNYSDLTIKTVVQDERLGLGHAVSLTGELAGDDDLLIVYGDTIIDGDLSEVIHCDADGMIAVMEVRDPRRFGVVNIADGFITGFEEKPSKPRSNLAIVGFNYIKKPRVLFECLNEIIGSGHKTRGEFQITDAFQRMVERGLRLKPLAVDGWFDCGTPRSLLETNRHMLTREKKDIAIPGSIIIPPVSVPVSADIIQSIIGPYVSVGSDTVINHSIISDSIIGSGSHVSNASIVHSLIGDAAAIDYHPRRLIIGDNSSLDFEFEES